MKQDKTLSQCLLPANTPFLVNNLIELSQSKLNLTIKLYVAVIAKFSMGYLLHLLPPKLKFGRQIYVFFCHMSNKKSVMNIVPLTIGYGGFVIAL